MQHHGPSLYGLPVRVSVCRFSFRVLAIVSGVVKYIEIEYINSLIIPNFYQIVTSTGNEPPLLNRQGRRRTNQTPRRGSRRPTDRVNSHSMRMENLMRPAVITEFEYADISVR